MTHLKIRYSCLTYKTGISSNETSLYFIRMHILVCDPEERIGFKNIGAMFGLVRK